MITGHFGLAAAAKSKEQATPLWLLMLAVVWLDVIFVPLVLMNVESFGPGPGGGKGYGEGAIHAYWSHSLVGAIVLSAVLGGLSWRRWGRRTAVVVGLMAFSHWVLDLVVHRPDLPLLPGNAFDLPLLGFGLWNHPVAAALTELALMVAGAAAYWRAVRRLPTAPAGVGRWAPLALLVAGLVTLGLDWTS
jgi:hypothetical protein